MLDSLTLFVIFIDKNSNCSWGEESFWIGDFGIAFLLFADDVVLLALRHCDLYALGQFAAQSEGCGMRVKSEAMVDCSFWVGSELLSQVKELKYLRLMECLWTGRLVQC